MDSFKWVLGGGWKMVVWLFSRDAESSRQNLDAVVALTNVNNRLGSLVASLNHDRDIQLSVGGIVNGVVTCVNDYQRTLSTEGSAVLAQKEALAEASSADQVNVGKMETTLHALSKKITGIRQRVFSIETEVNQNIEDTRERKREHEKSIEEKIATQASLQREVQQNESSIAQCEEDQRKYDTAADELSNHAREIDRKARERERAGIFSFIVSGVGIILAPVTGGLSLALTAVGAVSGTINLANANECRKNADRFRRDARQKREEAERLREEKQSKEGKVAALQTEIAYLRSKIAILDRAAKNLPEVTDVLRALLVAIDQVHAVFQSMNTAFKEAKLQTKSFAVIKNAFQRNPQRLGRREQVYMETLRESWEEVERVIQQGRSLNYMHISYR